MAILLALALLVAGASVALISALTYQHAVYPNTTEFSDALLKDLGVTREQAHRLHPRASRGRLRRARRTRRHRDARTRQRRVPAGPAPAPARRGEPRPVVDVRFIAVLSIAMGVIGWMVAGTMLKTVAAHHRPSALGVGERPLEPRRPRRSRRRAQAARRHLRRHARPAGAIVRRATPLLRAGLPRATESAGRRPQRGRAPAARRRRRDGRGVAPQHSRRRPARRATRHRAARARAERGRPSRDEVGRARRGRRRRGRRARGVRRLPTACASTSSCTPSTVVGDESLLESLVRNLVDNAGAAQPARRLGADPRRLLRATAPIAGACSRSRTRLPERSDPGRTLGRTGNQVGRTVVQSVVDAHHGTVRVELAATGSRSSPASSCRSPRTRRSFPTAPTAMSIPPTPRYSPDPASDVATRSGDG